SFLLLGLGDYAFGDYENTWNFYYEQPCCGNTNGQHHLRHHKDHVREFTCGKLYYRAFYLDEKQDALYVGAMDRVFKLNTKNVTLSGCDKDHIMLEPTGSDIVNCVSRGKSQLFECRNHVRVIQPMQNGKLYICGTNAHNPKDYVIYYL
ncbi:Semaphorin-2A, partial [Pseudolycoriella hygida]